MSGQKTRAWKARQMICAAASVISYAALTTSLAAQQNAKEQSSTARDARAQEQSRRSVSLPHIEVRRAKPQPRRRVTAVTPAPAPAVPPPAVQAQRGTEPIK